MKRHDVSWRAAAFDRYRRASELPLLVLAILLVPLLLVPLTVDLSSATENMLVGVDWLIWAVFAADYVIGLTLAPSRAAYLRREWPNLLFVALPMLRPLRLLRSTRLLHLARSASALAKATQEARRLLVRHHLHYALLASLVLVAAGGVAMYAVEAGGTGPIRDLADALWWAISTVTTVGYGDAFPVTAAGRGIAVVLMVGGIVFFGVLTANLATFLLERSVDDPRTPPADIALVLTKLDDLAARLDSLNARLAEHARDAR